ncbi:cell wall metabolism sensor histidine kinase WalK [Paenibacillus albiflavus]|uniref:histidine kinase n=1 Tax=Paenibacillus albiflavus TaxID=2545760 RepID=A0A4R4ECN6_9BACL|nr:cell wall metabolism sensor histidine kinase WalK [Paenibacillus albiflavus]TCZ75718.1 cell wall metabolism sensor histidine kinase WalK [Paenibacillus albiflavus]
MKIARFFQSIQSKLIIIYVLLILIAMQMIAVYFYNTLESYFKSDFVNSYGNRAYLLAQYVEPYLKGTQEGTNTDLDKTETDLNNVVNDLFASSDLEIQIIDNSGVVLASSVQSQGTMLGNKNTIPEVTRALQGIKVNERIFTDTDGSRKMIFAKPVGTGVRPYGAVYIAASMEEMYGKMDSINQIFITGTIIALGLTAVLGVILSGTITKPIKELTKGATAVAEGNFSQSVRVYGKDEISQLGHTFNFMMNSLKDALASNEEERDKLASILTNMNDGVIASDGAGQIILMNRRAQLILGLPEEALLEPLTITDVLPISMEEIKSYIKGKLNTMMLELEIPEEDELISVRVTFTKISRSGDDTGTIVVLQDVTEQEKLEVARRDFVANVSHELRTPLTTIKSYLEALDDGALEDQALAQRFIGVTRNETERMIRLVSDLLHLSRLDSDQAILLKKTTSIDEMLEEVADRFSFQLRQRHIHTVIDVQKGLDPVLIDRDKIDQVLDNLISNSIKYTGENGTIRLEAHKYDRDWIAVTVLDTGVGIPRKHISRIFDRFYRVDKARSRNVGGTGLGLSIAREIVKAHGGSISLESETNQGTKVTFTLPIHHKESEQA